MCSLHYALVYNLIKERNKMRSREEVIKELKQKKIKFLKDDSTKKLEQLLIEEKINNAPTDEKNVTIKSDLPYENRFSFVMTKKRIKTLYEVIVFILLFAFLFLQAIFIIDVVKFINSGSPNVFNVDKFLILLSYDIVLTLIIFFVWSFSYISIKISLFLIDFLYSNRR